MRISEIVHYLIALERKGFTGSIELKFVKGNVSKKIKKIFEEIEN